MVHDHPTFSVRSYCHPINLGRSCWRLFRPQKSIEEFSGLFVEIPGRMAIPVETCPISRQIRIHGPLLEGGCCWIRYFLDDSAPDQKDRVRNVARAIYSPKCHPDNLSGWSMYGQIRYFPYQNDLARVDSMSTPTPYRGVLELQGHIGTYFSRSLQVVAYAFGHPDIVSWSVWGPYLLYRDQLVRV